ncbi:MAG: hypothetical protein AAFQ07_12780 [Chloroflexota bacterium]
MQDPNEKDDQPIDDIEPIYNPVTADGDSPIDDWFTDTTLEDLLDIDAIYNPATMEFTPNEDEDEEDS